MTHHIFITGASRGMGAAMVAALRERDDVRVHGASSIDGDLSDPAVPNRLWADARDALGGTIDALINCAGVFEANPIDADDAAWSASWQRTLQINLVAAADLSRQFILHRQALGQPGRIINIASRAAYRGDSPAHWHYAASKAGMVAMTKSIARGYAKQGILAMAICPGFTLNDTPDAYFASRGGDGLLADIPLGRVATAEEVAAAAIWCATDAPESMTGAVLDLNGASYVR